jgi:hypothetical protein
MTRRRSPVDLMRFKNTAKRARGSGCRRLIDALKKAREAGFRDADWTRRDPDLTPLHGDPDFERLYPAAKMGS